MNTNASRLLLACLVAAVLGAFVSTMPPRALPPPGGSWRPTAGLAQARGVLHVHTQRSDGGGTTADVARAAARTGLDFVVLADHGDGTRTPDPPQYRSGVLLIDAVEISTTRGHVMALGMPAAAPFRLAGEPRDVVEDIHRFGGAAFVTHPDSPKPALAWSDWSLPVDGFEWINADSEWRDEGWLALIGSLTHYWLRGPESIAAVFDRPAKALDRWDGMAAQGRSLVAIAGADAHARLSWRGDDSGDVADTGGLPLPSYETVFRVLSTHVVLDHPLTGHAAEDASRVLMALRAGRSYATIDAFARGGALDFTGEASGRTVQMGERVAPGTLSRLVARVRAPVNASVRLLRDGDVVAESSGLRLDVGADRFRPAVGASASYRIEVVLDRAGDAPPWILSNPIRESPDARQPFAGAGPMPPDAANRLLRLPPGRALAAGRSAVECDPASEGRLRALTGDAEGLEFEFRLSDRRSAWVAVALPLDEAARARLTTDGTLRVSMRASAPMRVSVQFRAPSASEDLRWRQSVFVGPAPGTLALPMARFEPVGESAAARRLETATALLFVIDRTNTTPGTRGRLSIESVALQ